MTYQPGDGGTGYPQYGQQPPQQPGFNPQQGYAPQPGYGAYPAQGQGEPGYGYGQGAPQGQYASWGVRVGAAVIDGLPNAALGIIGSAMLKSAPAVYALCMVISLGWSAYNRWYLGGSTGQSWGKKITNIKLVNGNTGAPIGIGMAFVRDVAHIVDAVICLVGYLFPLWDAKRQTLADKICGTVVLADR